MNTRDDPAGLGNWWQLEPGDRRMGEPRPGSENMAVVKAVG